MQQLELWMGNLNGIHAAALEDPIAHPVQILLPRQLLQQAGQALRPGAPPWAARASSISAYSLMRLAMRRLVCRGCGSTIGILIS